MNIDPAFYRAFGTWLNADTIDFNDRPDLLRQARMLAGAVHDEVQDLPALIKGLTDYLAHPVPEVTRILMDISNVDWLADEEAQQVLREALTETLRSLQEWERSQRSD